MTTIIIKTPEAQKAGVELKRLRENGSDVELKVPWKLGGRHSSASHDERRAEAARDLYAAAAKFVEEWNQDLSKPLVRFGGAELTGTAGDWSDTKKNPLTGERSWEGGGTAIGHPLIVQA